MIHRIANIPHLAALRHRDYLLTWTSNMCSGAGMWTFIVAVSWLILEKSDSSGDVGIVTFASMLPFLVASPFAGLIADAVDRRGIARITFISNALLTAIVTVLATTGALTLWHLSVLTFISGVMRSTQEPAMSALIPNQVPREDLLNAITLNAATRHGARFFGLLVAAPLLAIPAIGVTGVLVLSAVFQVAGTLFISAVRTRSTGEVTLGRNILADMGVGLWNGVKYIYTNKMISIFILLVAFHCALVMSYDSVLPVFSRDTLGGGRRLAAGVYCDVVRRRRADYDGADGGGARRTQQGAVDAVDGGYRRADSGSAVVQPGSDDGAGDFGCDGRFASGVHGAYDYLRADDSAGPIARAHIKPVHSARGRDNGVRQSGVRLHGGRAIGAADTVRDGGGVPSVPVQRQPQPAGFAAGVSDGTGRAGGGGGLRGISPPSQPFPLTG